MKLEEGTIKFDYTRQGDGTVPWVLGQLDGVETYYVDAEHGQLPNYPPAFAGLRELLSHGRTNRLPTIPPQRREMRDILSEPEPEADEIRYYPNAADLVEAIAGRPRDRDTALRLPLNVEITNGDIREAKHTIIVGHYIGDSIDNVEAILDQALGGLMTRDLLLGRYPGPHGTVRIYGPSDILTGGVIVTGLGEVGDLQRLELQNNLTSALLEYALQHLTTEAEEAQDLQVSTVLIGSVGSTRITVENSVAAIISAAVATNKKLSEQNLKNRVRIRDIEIVERYQDIATHAVHAAQGLSKRYEGLVHVVPQVHIRSSSRRTRPYSPYTIGWNRRLRIRTKSSGFHYELTTELARSEPFKRSIQWGYVDSRLKGALRHDSEAPSTLFQYLLPYQLIDNIFNMPDLVLGLDSKAAQVPWELLDPGGYKTGVQPLGVRVGMLRTLSTITRRENPRRATGHRAIVIGDPANVNPPLPGARHEAKVISQFLGDRKIEVSPHFGENADQIFDALYRYEYDIIHIAAHGQFSENSLESGVLLGQDRFLTSHEFENLRAVPSLVFLNCCYLGKMGDVSQSEQHFQPGRLAASVAKHLIQMGVGVVVVAGWAVDDGAALEFAKTLYEQLLDGNNLMTSVRVARAATYDFRRGGDLTWGAYQVYGDPGYKLRVDPRDNDHSFVSFHELHDYLQDFPLRASNINTQKKDDLKQELEDIENNLSDNWETKGIICNAFGQAYAALGFYVEAIQWYKQAIQTSDSPIEAVEQLANLEGRVAERVFYEDPEQGMEQFKKSLARLQTLNQIQPSAERYSLIGATLKRWAKKVPFESQTPYIQQSRDQYAEACTLNPSNLYYPLSQKVALDLCLEPNSVKSEDLERIEDNAQACADQWSSATIAEASLIRYLAFGKGDAEETAQKYLHAWFKGVGTSQREQDSMLGQIDALVELAQHQEIREKVQEVKVYLQQLLEQG